MLTKSCLYAVGFHHSYSVEASSVVAIGFFVHKGVY